MTDWADAMSALIDSVRSLPPGCHLRHNDVGNLLIFDERDEPVGFIDVMFPADSHLDAYR